MGRSWSWLTARRHRRGLLVSLEFNSWSCKALNLSKEEDIEIDEETDQVARLQMLGEEGQEHHLRTRRVALPLKYKLFADAIKKVLLPREHDKDQVTKNQLKLMSAILLKKKMKWANILLQQLAVGCDKNFYVNIWSMILEQVLAIVAKEGKKLIVLKVIIISIKIPDKWKITE
ncbi:hypothetical protein Droror1_Dr00002449 [Drosera rotundifolia]